MKILKELLNDQNLDVFFDKHFTRLPLAIPGGAKKFTNLLNWPDVEKIIDGKKSYLRVVKDGRMVKDYADYDFKKARALYEEGNTLLVKNAERSLSSFKLLADDFAQSFHTPVDIQLYCTPEGNNAFGWHYDVEEVFIIQAKGSKLYSIRQNTVHPNPLVSSIPKNMGYEQEKSELELKVLLKEGDWLYIPSGWWHIARTQEESMHISIGLMPRSALDIIQYLHKYLSSSQFWRTRMPVHQNFATLEEEVLFYQEAMGRLGKDMEQKLSSPEFIRAFLSHIKSPEP